MKKTQEIIFKNMKNDEINLLIKEFKRTNKDNITEIAFLEKADFILNEFKHTFKTLNDVLQVYSIQQVVSYIVNHINIETKENNSQLVKKTFKFKNKKGCCLAPYSTMNFDTLGQMRFCCYNNQYIMGRYPEVSVKDAWFSEKRTNFIEKLSNLDFSMGCMTCEKQILENDIANSLFTNFDKYEDLIDDDYPASFSFEFGTICNYECIMCGGKWSSSIRKNRENLPPLTSPYDDFFVDQLKFFIPHLKSCEFLGGEPFLNSLYYKILDLLLEMKPDIRINITTNGSVFNSRIKTYFEKFKNLNINVSLDSLDETTYQKIRKNGVFKNVMSNIEEFKKHKVFKGLAFCPMIQNVHELPNIVDYCITNNLHLALNDVHSHLGGKIKGIHEMGDDNGTDQIDIEEARKKYPHVKDLIPEVALHTLSKDELNVLIKDLTKFLDKEKEYTTNTHLAKQLFSKYKSFLTKLTFVSNDKLS
jgi:MoaA/NifB/PqqE/SkfB family radical SAM enzyme